MPALKTAEDIGVYRPTVFFFTDGEPNDSEITRLDAWEGLVDPQFEFHPNVFTFGIGEADRDVIRQYKSGHGLVFIQQEDRNIEDSIMEILELLIGSIVSSAIDPSQSSGQIIINDDALDELENLELLD